MRVLLALWLTFIVGLLYTTTSQGRMCDKKTRLGEEEEVEEEEEEEEKGGGGGIGRRGGERRRRRSLHKMGKRGG